MKQLVNIQKYCTLSSIDVPYYDTSVENAVKNNTPVLPSESQYINGKEPIHQYKTFNNDLPFDPLQFNLVKKSNPVIVPTPTPKVETETA